MGQLEKYGLYVLCLVIFLILGVALWGDPAPANAGGSGAAATLKLDGGSAAPGRQGAGTPAKVVVDDQVMRDLLDKKDDKAQDPPKPGPGKEPVKRGGDNHSNQPAPAPDDDKRPSYTVVDGDVLSTIAQKRLGSMRHVDAILKLNPKVDPKLLKPGTVLVLPSKQELGTASKPAPKAEAAAEQVPAGTQAYTVVAGDSFEAIAVKRLKSKARSADIQKLNPGIDPRKLRPGAQILVPAQ